MCSCATRGGRAIERTNNEELREKGEVKEKEIIKEKIGIDKGVKKLGGKVKIIYCRDVTVPLTREGFAPTVKINSEDLRTTSTFMIVSGSGPNLIKKCAIRAPITINEEEILRLNGITAERVTTLGLVKLSILGRETPFHMVADDFPIPQAGILGSDFLVERNALINYRENQLEWDDGTLPFESDDEIRIPARAYSQIFVKVLNPEVKEGYISRISIEKGVSCGEAVVKVGKDKKGNLYRGINTNQEEKITKEEKKIRVHETCKREIKLGDVELFWEDKITEGKETRGELNKNKDTSNGKKKRSEIRDVVIHLTQEGNDKHCKEIMTKYNEKDNVAKKEEIEVKNLNQDIKVSREIKVMEEKRKNEVQETFKMGTGNLNSRSVAINLTREGYAPVVKLSSEDLRTPSVFIVDSGSRPNLVKKLAIGTHITTNRDEILGLSGITAHRITTLGQVKISILGCTMPFHVVADDFPIPQAGLLGSDSMVEHRAVINYADNQLKFNGRILNFELNKKKTVHETLIPENFVKVKPKNCEGATTSLKIENENFDGEGLNKNDKNDRAHSRVRSVEKCNAKTMIYNLNLRETNAIDENKNKKNKIEERVAEVRNLLRWHYFDRGKFSRAENLMFGNVNKTHLLSKESRTNRTKTVEFLENRAYPISIRNHAGRKNNRCLPYLDSPKGQPHALAQEFMVHKKLEMVRRRGRPPERDHALSGSKPDITKDCVLRNRNALHLYLGVYIKGLRKNPRLLKSPEKPNRPPEDRRISYNFCYNLRTKYLRKKKYIYKKAKKKLDINGKN